MPQNNKFVQYRYFSVDIGRLLKSNSKCGTIISLLVGKCFSIHAHCCTDCSS